MGKHNEANERLKRDYFAYLKEARRYDEQSVDAVAKAISRFEDDTKRRDFKAFRTYCVIFRWLMKRVGSYFDLKSGPSISDQE